MEFSSLEFLIRFLPIFLIVYYVAPARLRNPVLFLGSILFYSMGSWQDAILLAVSMTINFIAVLIMDRQRHKARRVILILLLIYNVGMLCFFKYTDWALPLGISFYTFTMLSYVLDVYWKKEDALTNYLDFGTYVWMFPKLIMGPIASFRDTADQLRKRRIDKKCIEHGISLFVVGLGYKVIIANHLAILWRDIQGIGFESISTPLAWIGAAGYSAQLFFDFQGYSLMAFGIGEMLGFSLPQNFNHPYRSKTVSEYYRRWHISLGQWFRNYLYIPLGGNRKGAARTFLNLLVVWV
ncbi:MAG: MBOAT family protein, partial [Lachnospiraceae bacterium]|nr:MBOAT family protein [Lachnospiraceae bacterium]